MTQDFANPDVIEQEIEQQTYWAMVPEWVIFHKNLSPEEKWLYMVLARKANGKRFLWWSQKTLAAEMGVTDRSVRRWMQSLEFHGALVLRKRRRNATAVWWLPFDHPVYSEEQADEVESRERTLVSAQPKQDRTARSGRDRTARSAEPARTGQPVPPNESHIHTKPNEREPTLVPRGEISLLATDKSIQSSSGVRSKAVTLILDRARSRSGKQLTGSERRLLRKPIDEWLSVGHSVEAVIEAIGSARYRTGPAIGGELERAEPPGQFVHSVGNDTLATGAEWARKQEETQ